MSLPNEVGTPFLAAYPGSSPHIQRNVPAANIVGLAAGEGPEHCRGRRTRPTMNIEEPGCRDRPSAPPGPPRSGRRRRSRRRRCAPGSHRPSGRYPRGVGRHRSQLSVYSKFPTGIEPNCAPNRSCSGRSPARGSSTAGRGTAPCGCRCRASVGSTPASSRFLVARDGSAIATQRDGPVTGVRAEDRQPDVCSPKDMLVKPVAKARRPVFGVPAENDRGRERGRRRIAREVPVRRIGDVVSGCLEPACERQLQLEHGACAVLLRERSVEADLDRVRNGKLQALETGAIEARAAPGVVRRVGEGVRHEQQLAWAGRTQNERSVAIGSSGGVDSSRRRGPTRPREESRRR